MRRCSAMKQLAIVLAILILASSESSGQALRPNDSVGTNCSLSEAELYSNTVVDSINQYCVTLPCILLFSLVFVCHTGIVSQQRLHGWIVMATSGSFALRFGLRFLNRLPVLYLGQDRWASYGVCVTFGVLHHFFLLMCYCWAVVLAYDFWRRVKRVREMNKEHNEIYRFLAYSAFGFGVPLFNVILAAILEWSVNDSTKLHKPTYHIKCRVSGLDAQLYYVWIPMGTLIATNLALIVTGLCFLWRAKKRSKNLNGTGRSVGRNLTGLFARVFGLMGGFIIADLVIYSSRIYELNPYLQVPLRLICGVGHAVGFFWIFVWSGTAKEQLRRKYPRSFGRICDFLDKRRGLRPKVVTITARCLDKSTEF